jgi:hypothetical protein
MILIRLLFIGFVFLSYSAASQSKVAGSYLHFRSFEKDDAEFPQSGSGGIIELQDTIVNFIQDSVKTTYKRSENKIWFNDSLAAQIIYEHPDSVRLLLRNRIYDYKSLYQFSSSSKQFLNELKNNTWDFTSDDLSFSIIPENKLSNILHRGSIHLLTGFGNTHIVATFHLKAISYDKSLTLFGFDLGVGFTTIQMINRNEDTVNCEMYRYGELIPGKLIKRQIADAKKILEIKEAITSKQWLATWQYLEKKHTEGEIEFLSKGNSYINSRDLKKENVTLSFTKNGNFQYQNRKKIETGFWSLSPDGNYLILNNPESSKRALIVSVTSNEVTIIKFEHIEHKREFLYGEKIVFK